MHRMDQQQSDDCKEVIIGISSSDGLGQMGV